MTMKKALIASTALVLSAGVAAADVTLSGYGRTGVVYKESDKARVNETQIVGRLRINADASTSTDQGIEFGGRIRLQWDHDDNAAKNSPAYLFVTSNGLTVSVGNVNTAYDAAGLMYEPELGAFDNSEGGTPVGSFFAFDSSDHGNEFEKIVKAAYPNVDVDDEGGIIDSHNRIGVAVEYAIDSLTLRASYVDPDQSGLNETTADLERYYKDMGLMPGTLEKNYGLDEEIGIGADYVWNEKLEFSIAAVQSGAGIEDNDQFFVGARYAIMDSARIGLNYIDNGELPIVYDENNDGVNDYDLGGTVVLYGDYTLADGLTNIEAFIANNDGNWEDKESDNAYGVGVNYDLGGARLGASLQQGYEEKIRADMGVRFDF